MDFNSSLFGSRVTIPADAQVVFVADLFSDEYVGGAELTTQALIDSSPFKVFCIKTRDLNIDLLKAGSNLFWVFGNFADINSQLIPSIVANLRYTILEYDYKYCKARSPEKHLHTFGSPCDCENQMNGKLISAFFYGAMAMWWMSEKQKERYHTLFPFLANKDNFVLSSVFDPSTLAYIKHLREQNVATERKGWIVLGSKSWIKGLAAAQQWCVDNQKEHDVVWDLPYDELLKKLSTAEGFVYLPEGGDTCPRMVIEAKLLGCQLHLNDNVQHINEDWFSGSVADTEGYLGLAPTLFWNAVKRMSEYKPTISGYTTTLNCVRQGYPYIECIQSMLEFCDEVCVVDGGSDDGTVEAITRLNDHRVKVKIVQRDWSHPRFAVFDGQQKAEARLMCTKEFCWQMDSDEIVHEDDAKRIPDMCRSIPPDALVIALPVTEYWGGDDKVRLDIMPWKWRLSRNHPDITHGIPKALRHVDANGDTYAEPGTDGCDMISVANGNPCNCVSFYSTEIENLRRVAMMGNVQAKQEYEQWFNNATEQLPGVFHYSWFDLSRKIKLYKGYWTRHWSSLYNKTMDDTAETNMMFDAPWSDVTDEMIEARAKELKEIGGWIWHRKWDGSKTPWINSKRTQPKLMRKQ